MAPMPAALVPLDLLRWIDDHRDEFEPPVSNRVIWPDSEFIVMVVRGPNARNDFHVNPGDEIFYQLEGTIRVDVIDGVRTVEHLVGPGDLLLVPAQVPHSPRRPADTWGVVIERQRHDGELDAIRWYCETCGRVVCEVELALEDIERDLKSLLDGVARDPVARTCRGCGSVVAVPGPFVMPDGAGTIDRTGPA